MAKRKPTKAQPIVLLDTQPKIVEGFASHPPTPSHMAHDPVYWNFLAIRKFRVTVELIDEPLDVLRERLRVMWRKDDNHHHYDTYRTAAAELGITLDSAQHGIEAKDDE